MSDTVYTLQVHDRQYAKLPSQISGVFTKAELATAAAHRHWKYLGGQEAMPLKFTSYESSHTGLDFHVGDVYRDGVDGKITYSVNGFTVQNE